MDHYSQEMPYEQHQSPWLDQHGYPPPQHSPIDEYQSYAYTSAPPPMDTVFTAPAHQHRPTHHQLQPLITTPWPSMLANQSAFASHPASHPLPPPPPPPPQPAQPPAHQPAPSPRKLAPAYSPTHPVTTPRRTLTDNDRRKMCQYHEDHPTKKQTEIGEIFGVERSTVSKVLRQKDKYLQQDDGSRSPAKKTKLNHPDIDRTLAKWVTNQQGKGVPLTDEVIRQQAKLFWIASGNGTECPIKIDSASWLEKFKQKNNFPSTKSRNNPNKSPTSPSGEEFYSPELYSRGASPIASDVYGRNDASNSVEGLGIHGTRVPFHSQSNTSLSSAFTDGAPPTFSSNTSTGSPVVSPDVVSSATSYFPISHPYATPTHPASHSPRQRSRSSTFHHANPPPVADPYISPPQSADASSPQYPATSAVFDAISITGTDMNPPPNKYYAKHYSAAPGSSLHAKSMPSLKARPPPHPSHPTHPSQLPAKTPSLTDARHGLEAALVFLRSQISATEDSADIANIRKVLAHLQMQDSMPQQQQLPGGLHRIPEMEFGRGEDEMVVVPVVPGYLGDGVGSGEGSVQRGLDRV